MIRPVFFDPLETVRIGVKGFAVLASMRKISIRVHCGDGSHSLFADKDLFARIVLNLLVNAIEHTPSGGQIDVDLSWSQNSERLQVSVADSGPEIRKGDQKRIFQKFFTTGQESAEGHLGLGLHFCKLAVEAHGGRIWVENHNGSGNRFLFSVPNGPDKH
jgi:signal transduction histidine kinase